MLIMVVLIGETGGTTMRNRIQLTPQKNLAGESQSEIVHCPLCWPSLRGRRLLTRAHRFCRRADIEAVPIKSAFIACVVSRERPYLGQ